MPRAVAAPKRCKRDLLKIFDVLNAKYFGGLVCGGIGWRKLSLGENASMGLCYFRERVIHINEVLDDPRVPLWYLRAVVFHEMLHLYLGPQQFDVDGYQYPHNERFKSLEARYPDSSKARAYEYKSLPAVMASWQRWRQDRQKRKGP